MDAVSPEVCRENNHQVCDRRPCRRRSAQRTTRLPPLRCWTSALLSLRLEQRGQLESLRPGAQWRLSGDVVTRDHVEHGRTKTTAARKPRSNTIEDIQDLKKKSAKCTRSKYTSSLKCKSTDVRRTQQHQGPTPRQWRGLLSPQKSSTTENEQNCECSPRRNDQCDHSTQAGDSDNAEPRAQQDGKQQPTQAPSKD